MGTSQSTKLITYVKNSAVTTIKNNILTSENMRHMKNATLGVFLCAVGCGFSIYADLGIAPFQSMSLGLNQTIGQNFSYGTYCLILNLMFLILPLLFNRKLIGPATIFCLFLSGYVTDWTATLLNLIFPFDTLWLRIVCLILGLLLMCYASALYYIADLGVSGYDSIPIILSDRTPVPFQTLRIVSDCICVTIGTFCGISFGVGTLITAFGMGPFINFFKKLLSKDKKRETNLN